MTADASAADFLAAVAQLALGVAGFSGIAMYFKRMPGPLSEIEFYRIAILFFNSFAAMFLSLVPFPLQAFGLEGSAVWRVGSALMAAFEVVFLYYYLTRSQRYSRQLPELFNRYSLALTYTGGIGNLLLQGASAAGLTGSRAAAVFMVGTLWLLFHATFQFGRILFVQPTADRLAPRESPPALAVSETSLS